VGDAPSLAAIRGFGLQRFAGIGFVVVADVDDWFAARCLAGVEFVVVLVIVSVAGGNIGEPFPGLAIIGGETDAKFVVPMSMLGGRLRRRHCDVLP
jgi:hypothetical protein